MQKNIIRSRFIEGSMIRRNIFRTSKFVLFWTYSSQRIKILRIKRLTCRRHRIISGVTYERLMNWIRYLWMEELLQRSVVVLTLRRIETYTWIVPPLPIDKTKLPNIWRLLFVILFSEESLVITYETTSKVDDRTRIVPRRRCQGVMDSLLCSWVCSVFVFRRWCRSRTFLHDCPVIEVIKLCEVI